MRLNEYGGKCRQEKRAKLKKRPKRARACRESIAAAASASAVFGTTCAATSFSYLIMAAFCLLSLLLYNYLAIEAAAIAAVIASFEEEEAIFSQ